MYTLKSVTLTFVYVVLICPLNFVVYGNNRHVIPDVDHHHHSSDNCDLCPRNGRCVPKVQCPAHMRPNSHNPLCHIGGHRDLDGICCFTGSSHGAESDHKLRSAKSINSKDLKHAHSKSKQKLDAWLHQADELVKKCPQAIVNESSPSFAHHLSVSTNDRLASKLGEGGLLNLFAAQELKARDAITDEEIELDFTEHADGPFCRPPISCPNPANRYRSFGGECNNVAAASWGALHTGFERLLPPAYADGIWSPRTSASGAPLPSGRVVSTHVIFDTSNPSATHNLVFMQFGQFIAHDTSAGVVFTVGNNSAISCCVGDGEDFLSPEEQHWACFPVEIPAEDAFYGNFRHRCLNLVRTQIAPSSDCTAGYAKQMNGATHHIDLSHLYGSSDEKSSSLRAPGGMLKTFNDYGRHLPPLSKAKNCLTAEEGAACFDSGDNHGNQIISLTILHTIWTREHNRIARALTRLNPGWNEDAIFFESRRILQAEFQHIIYNEWLPLLLGPRLMKAFELSPSAEYSSSYNPHWNPSLTAEFAAAAMRFGHSTVDSKFVVPKVDAGYIYEAISISEVMFAPSRMRLRPFLDRMIAGLTAQPMQTVDPFVTESLTRYLFHGGNPFGLDIASINIQRGRDYGLRPYNSYRKLCGLEPFTDFGQYPPSAAQRLSSVYESPDDVDLWVGGLMEKAVDGGIVGPTFACIIADQFARIKRGDRYFYENGPDVNPGAFKPSELAEIKKVSLSRILCDNKDGIELQRIAPNGFIRSDLRGNEPVPCDSPLIPVMDLNRFKQI